MTRDKLIEQLAVGRQSRFGGIREFHRADVWREWPLIVEFVAAWIEDGCGGSCSRDITWQAAENWRVEMSTENDPTHRPHGR